MSGWANNFPSQGFLDRAHFVFIFSDCAGKNGTLDAERKGFDACC